MSGNKPTLALALIHREDEHGPYVITAGITEVKRHEEPALNGATRKGLYAEITLSMTRVEGELHLQLSRLVGETQWVIDAQSGPDGCPSWVNPFGTRSPMGWSIQPDLSVALDAFAAGRGLVAMIGPDVPLILPAEQEEVTDHNGRTYRVGTLVHWDDDEPGFDGVPGRITMLYQREGQWWARTDGWNTDIPLTMLVPADTHA